MQPSDVGKEIVADILIKYVTSGNYWNKYQSVFFAIRNMQWTLEYSESLTNIILVITDRLKLGLKTQKSNMYSSHEKGQRMQIVGNVEGCVLQIMKAFDRTRHNDHMLRGIGIDGFDPRLVEKLYQNNTRRGWTIKYKKSETDVQCQQPI